MVKGMLQWQSYWKIVEKSRKMSCGAELLLMPFFFLPLQLVSADWDVLQQGKLIFSFVILLLSGTRGTLQHHSFPIKANETAKPTCVSLGIVRRFSRWRRSKQAGSERTSSDQAAPSEKGHFLLM